MDTGRVHQAMTRFVVRIRREPDEDDEVPERVGHGRGAFR